MKKIKKYIYPVIKALGGEKVWAHLLRVHAKAYLKKNKCRIKGTDTIKVAFIVYEPAMWDKQEAVYCEMNRRTNIDVNIVFVPDVNSTEKEINKKQIFFEQRYDNVVVYDANTINRFKGREFSYTFYQTPYSHKYPLQLRPHKIVKYSKICFIPYGYVGSPDFFDVTSNEEFFANVYLGFMDSEPMRDLLQKKFEKECQRGLQHFCFLGYPSLEFYLSLPKATGAIAEVLWIPRWSYAEKGGGSHFLEYKDSYTQLAKSNPDLKWTMRPHPLMFSSLEKQGKFSNEELARYKDDLATAKITVDEHSLLNHTLARTDLLLADYSSIIIMYLLSGRPVIYCDCNIELSGVYARLREIMYIANSWEDVLKHIKNIQNGIDPLKKEREKFVEEEGRKHTNSAQRIVQCIVDDYYN